MAAPTASPVFGMAGPMEALTAKVSVSEAGLMVARMAGLMAAPTVEQTAEQTVAQTVEPTAVPADKDKQKRAG
jgi:hypothetical protein